MSTLILNATIHSYSWVHLKFIPIFNTVRQSSPDLEIFQVSAINKNVKETVRIRFDKN